MLKDYIRETFLISADAYAIELLTKRLLYSCTTSPDVCVHSA